MTSMQQPRAPGDDGLATPRGPRPRVPRGVGIALAAVALAAVVGAGFLAVPRPLALGAAQGDEELAAQVAPLLAGQHHVAVMTLDGSDARFAGFGVDDSTTFEIGSVSKTFTTALLVEAVDRGEVTFDTTVLDVVGDRAAASAIADVRLVELASHTSGLPRLDTGGWLSSLARQTLRHDPYTGDAPATIEAALDEVPTTRGTVAYSNLGSALLGQLLAERAGTTYEALLTERITTPLGLEATYAPITAAGIRPDEPTGFVADGRSSGAWTMNGSAPAGGIRSTAADMAAYLRSVMAGEIGGVAGPEGYTVVAEQAPGDEAGIGWFRLALDDGRHVIWHNGGTGGFSSFVGFVEGTTNGVVVLADSTASVDEVGIGLLEGAGA